MVNIGKNIKKLRKRYGYTLKRMSEILHVSYSTLEKWEAETHRPNLETCCVIADMFSVDLDKLIRGEFNMTEED